MLLFDDVGGLFAGGGDAGPGDPRARLDSETVLRRLDGFDGVAILTTELDAFAEPAFDRAFDPVFRRRRSIRLRFALPDEALRVRLWAAYITPQIPTAGPLDLAALARRFPLSGGRIRDCALRAAVLAAEDRSPLTQAHLERAALREVGELGGRGDGRSG
jgi:AAA+ superfamily predicted ATPase